MMTATPSPNGDWLALRRYFPGRQDHLILVNRQGEVVEVAAAGK